MLLLSDCPERLGALGAAAAWSPAGPHELTEGERALWRALGRVERPWRASGADPGPPGFWSRALVVAEARTSPFDALREVLAVGPPLGGPTACAALSGRAFHGQRGRPWVAAPGNLQLSAAFPEPGLAARDAGAVTALPAVALVEAVRAMSGGALRPGIKWVNDVLLDGRKVGGVLAATQVQGDRVCAALVGIGLNVATTPRVPPTPFVPSVGSLAEAGARVTWAAALSAVLAALGGWMGRLETAGPSAPLDAYRDASLVLGRQVCVFEDPAGGQAAGGDRPPLLHRGVVRGLTAELGLLLEGVEAPVTRGRLAFAEHCRAPDP